MTDLAKTRTEQSQPNGPGEILSADMAGVHRVIALPPNE